MFTRLTGRIMEQALAFLAACARNPGALLAPSRVAGRFIHHLPAESGEENDGQAVAATVIAMRAAGLDVDTALWSAAGTRNR